MERITIDALMRGGSLDIAGARIEAGWDDILDARSESEFADDHLPGSVNTPVLNDAQRAEIGAIYVRESKFLARKRGAAHVSRNIAAHLDGALRDKPADYHPLVLCWRGGQRSGALATVLSQIGWRVCVLDGGYRAYRRAVVEALYHRPAPFAAALLDGPTGVGKTDILRRVAARGWPVVDLEDLARHRGSLFGADPFSPQPSQKLFEGATLSAMTAAVRRATDLGGARVLIEAESSKIGERLVPPALWKAMLDAPRIRLDAAPPLRARRSAAEYGALADDPSQLDALLVRLIPRRGAERVARWRALAAAGALDALAEALIREHYDPAYARAAQSAPPREGQEKGAVIRLDALDDAGFDAAADRVVAHLANAP